MTDDFEQQFEDVPDKVIQVQILMELRQIRELLAGDTDQPEAEPQQEPQFQCQRCNSEVPKSEVEDHASRQHNWDSSLGSAALWALYEPITGR